MTPRVGRSFFDSLFASRTRERDDEAERAASVAPPPYPLAKRLNRNALTVAALLMGITVITSLVVFNTGNRPTTGSAGSSAPTGFPPSEPTFLERPVRGVQPSVLGSSQVAVADSSAAMGLPASRARHTDLYGQSPGLPAGVRGQNNVALKGPVDPADRYSARREQAFEAALRRSAIAGGTDGASGGDAAGAAPAGARPSTSGAEERLLAFSDSVIRSAIGTASVGGTASTSAFPSLSATRRSFLRESGDLGGRSTIARLEPAGSPYTLRAGTVIPGVLLTAITSTLPGECIGQVARDVFDSKTQRMVLIPKGSKLICRYDDQVAAGQGRLLVAWTRLLLPDGRSMTLPGLALKDRQGQTGAPGEVDNHTGRVFGSALLLSAISAGVQLSQPRQASILAAPSPGQVAAGALGQELSNIAVEILRRGMAQPPTITIPQGQSFNVFLNGDLVFDGPYTPE